MREVGALGAPHGCRAQPEDDGGGDEGVVLRVELPRHVGRVAEHAHDERPLGGEAPDEEGGQEHAGDDQGAVGRGQGHRAQAVL